MKNLILITVLMIGFNSYSQQILRDSLMQFPRVEKAHSKKQSIVKKLFQDSGLVFPPKDIYWRAFKQEDILELWARDSSSEKYKFLKTYAICKGSGTHGPKRKIGDAQVPEGFYKIDLFNPKSSYHLSFRINYPNKSDSILGSKGALGGQIYIHGGCLTIGCLPLTNTVIEEVFLINLYTQRNNVDALPIPFHIFPVRFNNKGWSILKAEFGYNREKMKFWENLEKGYQYFQSNRKLPIITVNTKGDYVFQ